MVMNSYHALYACTVVGGTKYLAEWYEAVRQLNPAIIVVSRDKARSEPIPDLNNITLLDYSSEKAWKGYEHRHEEFASDYSICIGIVKAIEFFLSRDESHFVHIDSDVIIDGSCANQISHLNWDNLGIVTPVIPRDRLFDPNQKPIRFWESSNIGFSREIAIKALEGIKQLANDPFPIDIKIHAVIRSCKPSRGKSVISPNLAHYIRGVKRLFKEAA